MEDLSLKDMKQRYAALTTWCITTTLKLKSDKHLTSVDFVATLSIFLIKTRSQRSFIRLYTAERRQIHVYFFWDILNTHLKSIWNLNGYKERCGIQLNDADL